MAPTSRLAGLEELRLEGLGREAARRIAPHLTDRLYELTQGNPLALVELPEALTEAQLEGAEPINLGARVERAFRGRVQALSAPAQRALLIAAANDSDHLDAVIASGVDWRALGEAEDAGLVTFTGEAISFRHPLVRSAVYHSAAPSERRAAHAALARALGDVERRAWHLASAAIGPDEEVADALEQAAAAAQGRSGYGGASSAYERAARLSPTAEARVRRLLAAGDAAWNAGRTPRAIELLDEALAACDDDVLRGHLLNARGHIERHTSRPAAGYAMLVEAAALLDEASPLDAATARVGAWRAAHLMGDLDKRRAVAETLAARAEKDGGLQEFFSSLALGAELHERGTPRPGGDALRGAGRRPVRGGAALCLSGRHGVPGARGVRARPGGDGGGDRVGAGARRARRAASGAAAQVVVRGRARSLARRLRDDVGGGRDRGAAGDAALPPVRGLLELALLDAHRGDEPACRRHVEEARALLEPLGWTNDVGGRERLAVLELGLGRLDAAIELFESVPGRALDRSRRGLCPERSSR